MAVRNDTYVGNRFIFDDGVNSLRHKLRQSSVNYLYSINSAAINILPNPYNNIGTWYILSGQFKAGTSNSHTRVYQNGVDGGRTIGTFGSAGGALAGLTLGSSSAGGAGQCNCNIAYVLFRTGSDSIATQDLIFDALKTRFGL
jgi:hypothetical protein